jgi:mannose/cellobiose epimerase-like protein (N-acyl-D-glucosamine 2-epimerase family)
MSDLVFRLFRRIGRNWKTWEEGRLSSGSRPLVTGTALGNEARDALRRHVLEPLVPRLIDQEYGGFFVEFDDKWKPTGPQDKSLEHAVRTTRAFALLDEAYPGCGYDRIVRHGSAFLCDAMWDHVNGGFYVRVDRSGKPLWEGLKHPHAVTYAAETFLLAGPYLPPGEGIVWENRALDWLENVAWDPIHGGYWGSFRRNNERYADGAKLPTPDGLDVFGLTPGFKEINTQGDAIEMLTRFEERRPDPARAARLQWLVDLVTNRLTQPGGVLPYRYLRDWTISPDLARVGYQFLMARHILGATAGKGMSSVVTKAREMVDFCLKSARHPEGGFSYAVTSDGRSWPSTSPSSDQRQWWVQIEAVYVLHVLANEPTLEPAYRARYLEARDVEWAFLRDVFFDNRHGGIHGFPVEFGEALPSKMHCWKDPGHEVGAFIALAADEAP